MSNSKLFTFLLIFLSFSTIFSFYNFDSAYAQGVIWTYNADTNTATASGSGSTNFSALVAADTAGGWGKFTVDASGTQIICAGKIVVGDGTNACTFTDTNKQIICSVKIGHDGTFVAVKNSATLTLGNLINDTAKSTDAGCTIRLTAEDTSWNCINIIAGVDTSTTNLYGCTFSSNDGLGFLDGIRGKVYNCILCERVIFSGVFTAYTAPTFYNVLTSSVPDTSGRGVFFHLGNQASYDNVRATDVYTPFNFGGTNDDITVTNCYFRRYNYLARQNLWGWHPNVFFVNADVDSWNFLWNDGTVGDGTNPTIYRQYEFDLNVLNGEITDFVQNANVTLFKDGSKIYSALTNSSGMIPTQRLTYGFYQQATGNNIQNATSPYYLVISHPDWQTYVSRFYITQPLRLTVSMQEPTFTGYTEAEKSDYTTILLFIISLILCIIGLALTVPLLPLIALTVSVINVLFLTEISVFNILLIILNIIFTVITIVRTKTKNN